MNFSCGNRKIIIKGKDALKEYGDFTKYLVNHVTGNFNHEDREEARIALRKAQEAAQKIGMHMGNFKVPRDSGQENSGKGDEYLQRIRRSLKKDCDRTIWKLYRLKNAKTFNLIDQFPSSFYPKEYFEQFSEEKVYDLFQCSLVKLGTSSNLAKFVASHVNQIGVMRWQAVLLNNVKEDVLGLGYTAGWTNHAIEIYVPHKDNSDLRCFTPPSNTIHIIVRFWANAGYYMPDVFDEKTQQYKANPKISLFDKKSEVYNKSICLINKYTLEASGNEEPKIKKATTLLEYSKNNSDQRMIFDLSKGKLEDINPSYLIAKGNHLKTFPLQIFGIIIDELAGIQKTLRGDKAIEEDYVFDTDYKFKASSTPQQESQAPQTL